MYDKKIELKSGYDMNEDITVESLYQDFKKRFIFEIVDTILWYVFQEDGFDVSELLKGKIDSFIKNL